MSTTTESPQRLLVADTCSILDVLRCAARSKTLPASAATFALKIQAADHLKVRLAACDVTISEFNIHVDEVAVEVQRELTRLRNDLLHVNEVARAFGFPSFVEEGESAVSPEVLMSTATRTVKDLAASALVLPRTQADTVKAFNRSTMLRPPARKGSSSNHDCLIAERAIREAMSRPRASTFFLTSNTRDFCESGHLHPDLQEDFDQAGLIFVHNWEEAHHRLTAVG